jgi:large subunit ribosomal protein L1
MGKKKTIIMDQNQEEELSVRSDNKYSSPFDLPEEFALLDQKLESTTPTETDSETTTKKPEAKKSKKASAKKSRSHKYLNSKKSIEKQKQYKLEEAIKLLLSVAKEKFDSSVELNVEIKKESLSGEMSLPHGNGKEKKVAIFSDDILKQIEDKKINFDLLIAKPQDMPKLAKYARILGPKGLMPNPKNGTVSADPEKAAQKLTGTTQFKTEKKAPLIHISVGKKSFGEQKLNENISAALNAINPKIIKSAYIASSMSPSVKLDIAAIQQ